MKLYLKIGLVALLHLCASVSRAQTNELKAEIEKYISQFKADIGVAVMMPEIDEPIIIGGQRHYPMGSLDYYYLSLLVFKQVDKGVLSLEQMIPLDKANYITEVYSPLRETYPEGGEIALFNLMNYAITYDDANAADVLYHLVGGVKGVNKYLLDLGVKEVNIEASLREILKSEGALYKNWITPNGAIEMYRLMNQEQGLSDFSKENLWKLMYSDPTVKGKLNQGIPEGAQLIHKVGILNRSNSGKNLASHDMGLVILPSGKQFFIAVFITNSEEDEVTNNAIIADICKIIYKSIKE